MIHINNMHQELKPHFERNQDAGKNQAESRHDFPSVADAAPTGACNTLL